MPFIITSGAGSARAFGFGASVSSASSFLLDQLVGAPAYAYSTARKLRAAYSGAAFQAYNGTTHQDIGFTSSGDVDTASLLAFAGSGTVFVSKRYDQSGNGNDEVGVNPGPPIVSSGVLITMGGKPAAPINGPPAVLYKASPTGLPLGSVSRFLSCVIQPATSSISGGISTYGTLTTAQAFGLDLYSGAITADIFGAKLTGPTLTGGTNYVVGAVVDTAPAARVLVNGAATSGNLTGINTTNGTIWAGNANSNYANIIDAEEILIFGNNASDIATVTANQRAYFGI